MTNSTRDGSVPSRHMSVTSHSSPATWPLTLPRAEDRKNIGVSQRKTMQPDLLAVSFSIPKRKCHFSHLVPLDVKTAPRRQEMLICSSPALSNCGLKSFTANLPLLSSVGCSNTSCKRLITSITVTVLSKRQRKHQAHLGRCPGIKHSRQ